MGDTPGTTIHWSHPYPENWKYTDPTPRRAIMRKSLNELWLAAEQYESGPSRIFFKGSKVDTARALREAGFAPAL